MGDYSNRYIDLVRGRGAFGKKPKRSVLNEIAKDVPVQVFHDDPSSGQYTVQTIQDVGPILEANVAEMNSGNDGYTPSRDLRKVASIPLIEVQRLMQQGINIYNPGDWDKIAAKLDSPDWLKFRTAPGRISRRANREYFRASTSRES